MRKLLVFGLLVLSFTAVAQDGVPSQAPYYQVTRQDSTIHPVGAIGLNADGHFTIKENTGTFRLSIGGNNGLSRTFNNFQLGGSPLIKNTVLNLSTFTLGFGTWARFRQNNIEFGISNTVTGNAAFVHGTTSLGSGTISAVIGGESATASGHGSVAMGRGTTAAGGKSFAGGWHRTGQSNGPRAGGQASFAFYVTDNNNTPGFGANAEGSAILGGLNNNIPSTSTYNVILGGNGISARAGETFQTYVQNFNIVGKPSVLDTAQHILVRDYSTGQVKTRSVSSMGNFWPLSGNFSTAGAQIGTLGGNLTFDLADRTFLVEDGSVQLGTFGNTINSLEVALGNGSSYLSFIPGSFSVQTGTSTFPSLHVSTTGNKSELLVTDGGNLLNRVRSTASLSELYVRNSSGVESYVRVNVGSDNTIEFENDGDIIINNDVPQLDTAEWVLVRENSTGEIKKRAASSIGGSSGTYTPTITEVANVGSHTAFSSVYTRVGDVVTVSGRVLITITDADTGTDIGISLPIASDFTASADCSGVATVSTPGFRTAAVEGHVANNYARLFCTSSTGTGSIIYFYTFQYVVK